MASIKRNLLFNLLSNVTGYLFPMITFPYVSRILGAGQLGELSFYGSVIEYVKLFATLGISTYAVRTVAYIRDRRSLLSQTTAEILTLHTLLTLGGYVVILILGLSLAQITDRGLFFICSLNILMSTIGVEWLYKGIEDFQYIATRALIIRILSLGALFAFVHDKDDLLTYALLNLIATTGNNVLNFVRLRQTIDLKAISLPRIKLWQHLRPALHIFALNVSVSIYYNLDQTMLGLLSCRDAVGYYAACIRLNHTIMWTILSVTEVVLPRLCHMAEGDRTAYEQLVRKGLNAILYLSLPICAMVFCLARPIILLFCGTAYAPAVRTLQLLTPILIVGSLSNFLSNILFSQNLINRSIIATSCGAVVNLILNAYLIPRMEQDGAAIASLIAEITVFGLLYGFASRSVPLHLISLPTLKILTVCLSIIGVLTLCSFVCGADDGALLLWGIVSALTVGALLSWWCRIDPFMEYMQYLTRRI